MWEAKLYRLRRELLWPQAAGTSGVGHVAKGSSNVDEGEIEASRYQALHVACRQCAKTLELQAAMSVSRLWQQKTIHYEAHNLLTGIYNSFTAGFDTLACARRGCC